MTQAQLRFNFGAPEHAGALHPLWSSGTVALCTKHAETERWGNCFLPPEDLPLAIQEAIKREKENIYISQGRFYGSRSIALLKEIGVVWVDLDFYKVPELKDMHPEYVKTLCLERCDEKQIPEPSLIIYSGQGLYLIWLHSPVQKREVGLDAWQSVQTGINAAFGDMGVDFGSMDAAKVLRLCGTVNQKTGRKAKLLGGDRHVWEFETLFKETPKSKIEVPKISQVVSLKNVVSLKDAVSRRRNFTGLQTAEALWGKRQAELIELIAYRWPRGVPEGYRDIVTFLLAVSISWVSPFYFHRELRHVLQKICFLGQWGEPQIKSSICSVQRRLKEHLDGNGIMYRGYPVDIRYRFRDDTLARWLNITEAETLALNLRHLRPPSVYKERERKREQKKKEVQRRAQGILLRESWLKSNWESESQIRPWEVLNMSRITYYRRKNAKTLPKWCFELFSPKDKKKINKKTNDTGCVPPVWMGMPG